MGYFQRAKELFENLDPGAFDIRPTESTLGCVDKFADARDQDFLWAASSRAIRSAGDRSYPVARVPVQLRPQYRPSFCKPGSHRWTNVGNEIGSGVKSQYAGTLLMIDMTLLSGDQKGIAVSPDAFVEVGKSSLSLMRYTCALLSTSETKVSALIAEMLMVQE